MSDISSDAAQDEKPVPADYKTRRTPRIAVEGVSRLRPQNLSNLEVEVRNVSPCGFMAECGEAVQIGSYVSLDIPGLGPVHAQIRWQLGHRMGGMFLDPISLLRCEWVATKAPAATEVA